MTQKRKITVGFLVFDGIQPLDLFGPLDSLSEANSCMEATGIHYELVIISEKGNFFMTESGIEIKAQYSIDNCPSLHTLIIPGGNGSRSDKISDKLINWIINIESDLNRVCSVCTGFFILAKTGLLDGRIATTHWNFVNEAKSSYPKVNLQPDLLFIKDDKYITTAGITAGIDMALSIIEDDMGPSSASAVARMLGVFFRRSGGQNQFSSFLQQQEKSTDRFASLLAWIADNLTQDLSTNTLASKVFLGERHFTRKYKEIYGETPSRSVERIRLDVAKHWLLTSNNSIATISQQTGFKSSDSFTRAFDRANNITPSEYRLRFGHFS